MNLPDASVLEENNRDGRIIREQYTENISFVLTKILKFTTLKRILNRSSKNQWARKYNFFHLRAIADLFLLTM